MNYSITDLNSYALVFTFSFLLIGIIVVMLTMVKYKPTSHPEEDEQADHLLEFKDESIHQSPGERRKIKRKEIFSEIESTFNEFEPIPSLRPDGTECSVTERQMDSIPKDAMSNVKKKDNKTEIGKTNDSKPTVEPDIRKDILMYQNSMRTENNNWFIEIQF